MKFRHRMFDDFEENEHPRDPDGKFGSGGGHSVKSGMKPMKGSTKLPEHIAKLKIPPAWTDVHYAESPDTALQVVGRDSKDRPVGVYSEAFKKTQAANKFRRVQELDQKFDGIRAQNEAARKDPKTKGDADCMAVVMAMGIRPGSDKDTKAAVKAYGATTLEGRHVVQEGKDVFLRFTGKKGVELNLPVHDPQIAALLVDRKKGDNDRLFGNVSDESLRKLSHSFDGGSFKPKDFRTLLATRTALLHIDSLPEPKDQKEYKKLVLLVAKQVSARLGNTPTVALQSYINPTVFSKWRAYETTSA